MKKHKFVDIIHIQIIGFSLLATIIFSCSSHNNNKLLMRSSFIEQNLTNDSLGVEMNLWGALKNYIPTKIDLKQISSIKKKHQLIDPFYILRSTVNDYQAYFFYRNNINNSNDTKLILLDSTYNISIARFSEKDEQIYCLVKSTHEKEYNSKIAKQLVASTRFLKPDSSDYSFSKIYDKYCINPHRFLKSRMKMLNCPITLKNSREQRSWLLTVNQLMSKNAQFDSLISSYELPRVTHYDSIVATISINNKLAVNQEVFSEIANVAKTKDMIILNEDHFYPKHRFFALKLLDVLKKEGYNILSVEALTNSNTYIPSYPNGIYIAEPTFGHFLRRAKALGFTIVGHENENEKLDREVGQARNLDSIFKTNPNSKVFVYLGHQHLEREKMNRFWMAYYLENNHKINFATINQATIFSKIKNELTLIPRSTIAFDKKTKSSADFFVINNLNPSTKNVFCDAKRYIYKCTLAEKHKNKTLLMNIFDAKDLDNKGDSTIPYIAQIVQGNKIAEEIYLPSGEYVCEIRTEAGDIAAFKKIKIR